METKPLIHKLQNLRKEVSCSICEALYTEPKMLPCLHSFCLDCLENVIRSSGRHDTFTCPDPMCKTEIRVPSSGDLKELPANFRLVNLLDVLAIKEHNSRGVKCGNCDKTSAQSSYCFQCCAFWCNECITGHNIIRANKEHRVLALQDFQDHDIENVKKRPAFCQIKNHKAEELKFFCKKCDVAICQTCIVALHDGHPKVPLKETANDLKLRVQSTIKSQKESIKKNMIELENIDNDCERIQEHFHKLKREVEQHVDVIIAVLEKKKQEIIVQVETKAALSTQRLEQEKIAIKSQVATKTEALIKIENLLKVNPEADILQQRSSFEKLLEGEIFYDNSLATDNEQFCEINFKGNQNLFNSVKAEQIGSLEDKQTASVPGSQNALRTSNVENGQSQQQPDKEQDDFGSCQGNDGATKVPVAQDDNDLCFKISDFVTEPCKRLAAVNLEPIPHLAAHLRPGQFEPVLFFGEEGALDGMFNYPWGVAVNERDELAITDHGGRHEVERVQVFTCDGTHLRSFGAKGASHGEFKFPTGIIFDKNGNIIVADNGNHRVQMFSDQGEYLSQFGVKGSLIHQLNNPLGLSLENDGSIIVTDNTNKLVKIFSSNGKFLHKIGRRGAFNFPFHCVQYGGKYYVSDRDKHCVKVFDGNGTYRYKFGRKGESDGSFNEPHCLAVSKAGNLMVCDSMNHRIQVFDLNGNFVSKFGTEGTGLGQFNKPVSLAVLSDGRIVVTDFCNHRIQIFKPI
ncbi:E3 ubiquitin-protein ligase TRIM71-like isoform X1 [Stylophora pistillata]|uniref:E3 ubiquitin-protein ligase TRIM71-like isoform X1 n=1 Tax=Stylophora pistillata TaxID=50429 RepID=UPI000C046316|nr:E3 ubiquitin-protein ligase TRIM71-like isoform X1 [Stylophora pistillata]